MTVKKEDPQLIGLILDSIGEGVFTVDTNFRITSCNQAAEEIIGIKREEALGQFCFDVLHANICTSSCFLRETMQTGQKRMNQQVDIINRKGKRIPLRVNTAVLRDRKGKMIGGVETFQNISEIEALKKEISRRYTFEDIVSKNHEMQRILGILPDIAESEATVLIEGASGTGKELVARAIHNLSHRKNKPYIVVNCGALPETLLESELFGYVKGAFTDAKQDKPGRFTRAQGGTIFLDEIGDLPSALQVKLLRVLQEKEFEPLGGVSPVKADVRVIAATHRNLSQMVKEGTFREDLFYRINVVKISLPPLKERQGDIPYLVEHFIERFNKKTGKEILRVSLEVMALLMQYDFPGNIRELENIIEHAFVLCRTATIEKDCLPRDFVINDSHIETAHESPTLKANECLIIKESLARHGGKRELVAQELGIDRSTLWRKMKKYQIK